MPDWTHGEVRDPAGPEVAGYEIGRLLRSGPRSIAYRGRTAGDRRAVVVKIQREAYPSDRALAAETRAFEIARRHEDLGLARHLALVPHGHGLALVTEDEGGTSLDLRLQELGQLPLTEVLEIGVALARALARLHNAGILHKDIGASNVVWEPGGRTLRLIDLKECSLLEREEADGETDSVAGAALIYAAPERTGRIARSVDARSDLYSVGILLFELLAGHPPFAQRDARELLHAHLARPPPAIGDSRGGIPAILEAIVARLLAKNPDDRYGSALGLAHDLALCLEAERQGRPADFALGAADARSRFALPERLYGREEERARLFRALERARDGQTQVLLVTGFSGIGKSALASEAKQPVAEARGWYCAGKFDQFLRDTPYLAWRGALTALVKQLLAEPEERLAALRERIDQALAGYGALIKELVPEIERLLGPQPALPDASPHEAQARFIRVFTSFFRAIAQADHPLAIFVDDLQWADLASLQMLEALASSGRSAHLLVLGAYRDNEVGPGHPLTASMARLNDSGHGVSLLRLQPLDLPTIGLLVRDTVHRDDAETDEFGRLVHQRTGGNPFFVRRFLADLHRKGHLAFDHDTATWQWDREAIGKANYTDNVVSLMSERIGALPADARAILQYAACLGVAFDLRTLVGLAEEPYSAVARQLDRAMAEGLIVPLESDYRLAVTQSLLAERRGDTPAINPRYRFLHDRVQASVHDSIDAEQRATLHLRIARKAKASLSGDGRRGAEIEMMDHLQECIHLLADPAERLAFARTCLAASRRATASTAIQPAVRYIEMGSQLLPADAWTRETRLTIELNLQAAQAFYVAERFEDARATAETILQHATDREERVEAHNVLIGIGVAEQRFVDATQYAIGVLALELGVRLPRNPSLARVMATLARTGLLLSRHRNDALRALPRMSDPSRLDAMAMLMKTATNAYWGNPNLVPVIASTMVRISLRQGNTGLSAYGYALTGMVLTNALGAIPLGYRLGQLSMELLEQTGDWHLIGKTGLLWHGFIRHSTDPLRVCAADVLECYDRALDGGDVENAVYCGTVAYYADLLAGRPLDRIATRYADYLPALLGSAQQQTILALKVWIQVAANLGDPAAVESKAVGEHVDWPRELAALLAQKGSDTTIATICGGPGWLAFLLDDWEEAERQLGLLYERQRAAMGQAFLKPCLAIYALVLAHRLGRGAAGGGRRSRLARLRRGVRRWMRHNPHDYGAFHQLLSAEMAANRGEHDRARSHWDDAMERARESGFIYLEAWAAERAARSHAAAGHTGIARHLWDRARQGWQRSGILARLTLRDRQFGAALPDSPPAGATAHGALPEGTGEAIATPSPPRWSGQHHDVESVLDAVHAVSEIAEVDELVTRVLGILLISAGARKGTLLIQEEALRSLATAAVGADGGVEAVAGSAEPTADRLPLGLVDYVVRSRTALAVEDARTHEWLARDPYVVKKGARSLLGAPLMRHGRLVGLVVLENDLGAGVFAESAVAVTTMIAGQAAVSLENARLFEAQRRSSEAAARFVPTPFLESIGRTQIEEVRLGDAVQQDITVMFADLRRSTSLSETMSVSDYFGLINALLAQVTPVIRHEGGFIDGFTGDGFRAIFVGPSDRAVRAAIAMQRRLRRYNEARQEKGWELLEMGIGIHSGPALLGTIGVSDRLATTVIGDTVNTASRIEGLTKYYRVPVLISQACRDRLEDEAGFTIREVGRDRVQGHQAVITVHEVIDARPNRPREEIGATVRDFSRALSAYFARDFDAALTAFRVCAERAPSDGLAASYRDQAARLAREGAPPGWDGVNRRSDK